MRILLVSSQVIPHIGGLSSHFQLLARTLEQRGALGGQLTGLDVPVGLASRLRLSVSRISGSDAARKEILDASLKRLSEELEHTLRGPLIPDVIHCHDPLASMAAHLALRRAAISIPVIQTVHGPWSREAIMGGAIPGGSHASFIRRLEECAFRTTAHLIAVDHGQAEILAADFGVPLEKITVISNGIDTERTYALSKLPSPVAILEPYFIVPRRLVKKNGVGVALKAIAHLRNSAVLAVAGDGPLRRELEGTARALKVLHRVRFLGNLLPASLLPLMRGALGVIVPSIPADGVVEATSIAALEGLACGTPIVVSEIGGLREIVSRAAVGFLFPPGDEIALASAMRNLVAMPDAELTILRQRTRRAAAAFDVRHWFEAIQDVYDMSLSAPNSSGVPLPESSCQ